MAVLEKQKEAYQYLKNDHTKFIIYGGGAGGGKSWLGCEWLIQCAYYIPNSRWFIGRNNIKDTIQSVLVTFKKVAQSHNFTAYKTTPNGIEFENGSVIVYLDCTFYPYKDPLFERFGSKEYTGGWLEEAGQIHPLAFDVLKSRVGRHLNKELSILPKIFITCNPKKNWLYKDVYKPSKEGTLDKNYIFIQSLATDNIFLPDTYIEGLQSIKDKATKERLLFGNWEYDNDPSSLIEYDNIVNLFSNSHVQKGKHYISADIAMQGSDKLVIFVWSGFKVIALKHFKKSDGKEVVEYITNEKNKYNVANSNIVYDSDGVGAFLGGFLQNAKSFVNNGKPISTKSNPLQYQNLKTQCYFLLAKYVNEHKISLDVIQDESIRKLIIEELEQVKSHLTDKDGKLKLQPKEMTKQKIGRSPDFSDALAMRMYFELLPSFQMRSTSI